MSSRGLNNFRHMPLKTEQLSVEFLLPLTATIEIRHTFVTLSLLNILLLQWDRDILGDFRSKTTLLNAA
jgi:hypothetical protein